MTEQAEAQPLDPNWQYVADKLLRQMDAVYQFTQEAAVSSTKAALAAINSEACAHKAEEFAQECETQVLAGKELLRTQSKREWMRLTVALLTCIGIMVSIAFFINNANTRLIDAYKEAAKAEVTAQNKNQERLEKELGELKSVLRQVVEKVRDLRTGS